MTRGDHLEALGANLVLEAIMRPLVLPNLWRSHAEDSSGWESWPTALIDMHDEVSP